MRHTHSAHCWNLHQSVSTSGMRNFNNPTKASMETYWRFSGLMTLRREEIRLVHFREQEKQALSTDCGLFGKSSVNCGARETPEAGGGSPRLLSEIEHTLLWKSVSHCKKIISP